MDKLKIIGCASKVNSALLDIARLLCLLKDQTVNIIIKLLYFLAGVIDHHIKIIKEDDALCVANYCFCPQE